jgi:hypothetical protein
VIFLKKERKSKEKYTFSTNEIFRDFPLNEFEFSGKLTNQIRKENQKKVEYAASGDGVPTSARCCGTKIEEWRIYRKSRRWTDKLSGQCNQCQNFGLNNSVRACATPFQRGLGI